MQSIITEGYVPGCIGRVTELHADYYHRHHRFGVDFEAKVTSELSKFCQSYQPGRDGIWLACDPCIQASIAIDGSKGIDHGAQLRWFITSDKLRGQGFGRALISRAINFADEVGYRKIFLSTFAGLEPARHLYEAFGFQLVEEKQGSTWGKPVIEQRFERQIA